MRLETVCLENKEDWEEGNQGILTIKHLYNTTFMFIITKKFYTHEYFKSC